ncbi:MAG: hypothetical protein WAJ88_01105 [Pseudolabrys sp.]
MPKPGVGIRGGDIDANGVAWGSESSGHLVSFDRSLCKGPLTGPQATGNHCPEGWKFYKYPGPGFEGFEDRSVEASYYTWVDQHNTTGLGENIPISTANLNDGFVALKNGKMVMLRIPIPWAFTPRVSTDASMIQMPAGEAAGCGAPVATARLG